MGKTLPLSKISKVLPLTTEERDALLQLAYDTPPDMNSFAKTVLTTIKPLGQGDAEVVFGQSLGIEPVAGTEYKRFMTRSPRRDGMGEAHSGIPIKRVGASLVSAELLKLCNDTPIKPLSQEDFLYYASPIMHRAIHTLVFSPRRNGLGDLVLV